MVDPPVQQIIGAHRDRVTGLVELRAGDLRSELFWRDGDVVGARLAWGHRSLAQALVLAGRLPVERLDALWASGQMDRCDLALLRSWGVSDEPDALESLRWLAQISAAVEGAQSARLLPGEAAPDALGKSNGLPLPGRRLVERLQALGAPP